MSTQENHTAHTRKGISTHHLCSTCQQPAALSGDGWAAVTAPPHSKEACPGKQAVQAEGLPSEAWLSLLSPPAGRTSAVCNQNPLHRRGRQQVHRALWPHHGKTFQQRSQAATQAD